MKVAICRSAKAYLPEADAYATYLQANSIEARCVDNRRDIRADEIAILFRFEDQFARDFTARRRIHEDHNIPFGLRGQARRLLLCFGPIPDGRILLDQVRAAVSDDGVPTISRPCGIDRELFEVTAVSNPQYDIVYCGSLDRPGVLLELERLANLGFRIAAIGRIPPGAARSRMEAAGVRFFGRLGRDAIGGALADAHAGLNYTPDRAPWNIQESVKTLEYLAAGLPVVANRYEWIERYAAQEGADILWLDDLESPDQVRALPRSRVNLADREWTRMLDRIGFVEFLQKIDA